MSDPKKVTIVTPEFYGDTMIGGLAVSVHGLAHSLSRKGIEVHVLMPSYSKSNTAKKFSSEPFVDSRFQDSFHNYCKDGIDIHKIIGINCNDLDVSTYINFIDIEIDAYKQASLDNFEAYQLFSSVIPESLKKLELQDSDVFHVVEWTMAGAAFYLRKDPDFSDKPIVLTSHNLNYIGEVPQTYVSNTSFSEGSSLRRNRVHSLTDNNGNLFGSLLELGIHFADVVNTVSPTEANAVLNGREGLDIRIVKALRSKGLEGILNGINPTVINPETDPFIEKFYTETYQSIANGKKANKSKIKNSKYDQFRAINSDKMLVSMMCRLADQKSIAQVVESSEKLGKEIQLAIVGEPQNGKIRDLIHGLKINKTDNVFIYDKFAGPELQHMILAASDAILQPSVWEPCGYTQLEGMAYGAIPIVTEVGGHIDTVSAFDKGGYGIFIKDNSPENIADAINYAEGLYNNKSQWKVAVMNAVNEDFTWSGPKDSVGKYLDLYQKAIDMHKKDDSSDKTSKD